mmetsp:Transcript_42261/g.99167  ORF Transcript_42261/g.99167 Transcript_42261/m.99167 type:complete len:220 (+) Transcript_42261:485-1144(+)
MEAAREAALADGLNALNKKKPATSKEQKPMSQIARPSNVNPLPTNNLKSTGVSAPNDTLSLQKSSAILPPPKDPPTSTASTLTPIQISSGKPTETQSSSLTSTSSTGPSSSKSSSVVPPQETSSSKKKGPSLRRGKWTAEEEAYANRLIKEFKAGLLPLTDGTTLRTFLSKLLNCDPMRISKKFVGGNCIGKQVFRRRTADINSLTPEQIQQSREELSE